MKIRTLLLLLVLVAIAAFAALNWGAFMATTTLSLGVAEIQAPLGLVMLGMIIFMSAVFLVFLVYLQASMLLETRRYARELQANRGLADKAEASRFTELHGFLDGELKRLATLDAESRAVVLTRLDALDQGLRLAMEQSENTLSACLGELEDRLENAGFRPGTQPPT
ncbi:LapA family protein [Rhodoferax ferrireducens]|uniref:LapA family protein n=1 Tax=Rhodoferax ferrireducens TaxID=192843 RepID=UPI000E0D1426|nr:LapA family protein [Rhodoferax ferrireducens]